LNSPISYILKTLLNHNSIKVDFDELTFQVESHLSYPSLHSLTNALDHFEVDNLALELPNDEENLANLPKHFIAHCKRQGIEQFVLATRVKNSVKVVVDSKTKEHLGLADFFQIWTGVVLVVENNAKYIISKPLLSYNFFYPLVPIGCFVLFLMGYPDIIQLTHFILSLIGVVISVFIVQYDLGLNHVPFDKICSGNRGGNKCADVINSPDTKLFGVQLSDLCIVYFSGISLAWLILSFIDNSNYFFIVTLSIASLPFTIYSIYYQYAISKKWCILCLIVSVILWGQVLSVMLADIYSLYFTMNFRSSFIVIFSLAVAAFLWKFQKPYFKFEKEYKKLRIDYHRLKNSYQVFKSLLNAQPYVKTSIDNSLEIVLGNKSQLAPIQIIIITNPFCKHCKSVHNEIIKLLSENSEHVQVRLRFNVNMNDEKGLDMKISSQLIAIYHKKNEVSVLQALDDIYTEMDIKAWEEKWNDGETTNSFIEELKRETSWCYLNNITFTPEILLNNRILPSNYKDKDLQRFTMQMIEENLWKKMALSNELYIT